jgi:hypothetical protein
MAHPTPGANRPPTTWSAGELGGVARRAQLKELVLYLRESLGHAGASIIEEPKISGEADLGDDQTKSEG